MACLVGASVQAAPSNWVIRSWQSRDGLPHDRTDALAQTPEGFLWLALSPGGAGKAEPSSPG